ncbi:L,D-transpeptidase scaffold domain-containing protein [Pedobacter alluvionis]|uniref:L,D-transpeptidase scaffold domain-containing protein n=1 Tax=Pedobacter alluvionis TaxID=475253 RepID=A0ABY2HK87_9SPHI|nr:hypothetical protein [Pedobacter alluvionis]TFB28131.1 hypothetical protein E3V97_24210 [Pedobacter alluvionis]
MIDFYRNRNYAYAWYNEGVMIEQAYHLSSRIQNIGNEGIYQTVPYARTLDSLINNPAQRTKMASPDVTTELMLSAQYFLFSRMAWQGQDDSLSNESGWFIPRKKIAYAQLLDNLLNESGSNGIFHRVIRH